MLWKKWDIRDNPWHPSSRSQISSSPGQDECWQECAKGAMCWEMLNPKTTIDIYWLYTIRRLYVLKKKVHQMCLEYLEYASKRKPKWRGAEVSQAGTSRETPLPYHYQTTWKSSCEEILIDSRESVSDASSMIQRFRTFFHGMSWKQQTTKQPPADCDDDPGLHQRWVHWRRRWHRRSQQTRCSLGEMSPGLAGLVMICRHSEALRHAESTTGWL